MKRAITATVDHLARDVQAGTVADTEATTNYAAWLSGESVPLEYQIAFDTYSDFAKRVKLESLLMGNCPDEVLIGTLGFTQTTLDAYRELFFDLSVLHTDIDKLVFAERYYKENTGRDVPAVDNLILRGYNQGYHVLLLQYCNLVPTSEESLNILRRVFAGAVYKATSVQYTGMGSTIDKRAIEHCQLALKILDTMKTLQVDPDGKPMPELMHLVLASAREFGSHPSDFNKNDIV